MKRSVDQLEHHYEDRMPTEARDREPRNTGEPEEERSDEDGDTEVIISDEDKGDHERARLRM